MPKISIIVPVYKVEKYLRRCLDSIINQTFIDWECILVDDGSPDNSGKICVEYAKKDKRFIVVHKQNEGVAKARITAFENSTGELITFIDSDDYVSELYLENLSKPIIENDADMVSCNYFDYIETTGIISGTKKTLEGSFEGQHLSTFIANHYFYDTKCHGFGMTNFLCTKIIKRDYVLDGLKKGLGMWFGEDQIAMFSMLYHINRLYIISDRMYYYVRRTGQATTKYDFSLWQSLIYMFKSYKSIDTKSIADNGLRKRTWLYIIRTISDKMLPQIDKKTFLKHLTDVRKNNYINNFFKPLTIDFGIKHNIKYLLLKLKLFSLLYFIAKH